jgi:hypothetical protein
VEIWGAVAAATLFESLAVCFASFAAAPRRNELLLLPDFDLREILPVS